MKASEFTHDDCLVGNRRYTYTSLQRTWCCSECGGWLILKWSETGWYLACGSCGGQDFIHQAELERQEHEAAIVLDGLPIELAALIRAQ